jgi:hypothetical protein
MASWMMASWIGELDDGELARKRGSVTYAKRTPVAIHLSSPPGVVSERNGEPVCHDTDEPPMSPLDLAPSGVSQAAPVTWNAGALLPHRFTLPCAARQAWKPSGVYFLLHFPASYLDWPLASTLPFGAPTFLDRC